MTGLPRHFVHPLLKTVADIFPYGQPLVTLKRTDRHLITLFSGPPDPCLQEKRMAGDTGKTGI